MFPLDSNGKRSTSLVNKTIWSEALNGVDESLAKEILSVKNWRKGYADYVYRFTQASVSTPQHTLKVAQQGLQSIYNTFKFVERTRR